MKRIISPSVQTTLATLVAGVVVCLSGCGRESAPESADEPHATAPRTIPTVSTGRVTVARHTSPKAAPSPDAAKKMLPDALMRLLVEEAVNANDYKKLSILLGKLDRIGDPAIRLRLLEGLNWFDETAVADALPFLVDTDAKVASFASEIVSSRITSVARTSQREKLYVAALKLMPDSPDRDILVATLEGERKSTCIHVLHDLEAMKTSQPALWRKLTNVYESHFGRPYTGYIDALLHFNPRDD